MPSVPSALPTLKGRQEPRIEWVPPFASTVGDRAIEVAALAGLQLDEWQQGVLRKSLGERPDWQCPECVYRSAPKVACPEHPGAQLVHPWAAPTVALVCPRQNGKNAILEARELAGLFLLGEKGIIHSAHEQATASEQFRRLVALIKAVPEFENLMAREIHGKGSEAIELVTGQRILFKTRTGGGARGFSIDLIIFDEAYELPEASVGAVVPTRSARPNAQTWYTSSAVDQQKHHNGVALARQRARGIAKKPGIAYFEWSIEGDNPARLDAEVLDDPRSWADANPSFNIRLSSEAIQGEHDGDMGRREFAVERLGVGDWPETDENALRIISLAKWDNLVDAGSTAKDPVTFAFDVTPDRSAAAIAVAGDRPNGGIHVGIIDSGGGLGWVVPQLAELVAKWHPYAVVLDAAGPAGSLVADLEKALGRHLQRLRKKELTQVSARQHGEGFGMVLDLIEHHELHHRGQPSLRAAIDGADKRPLGDAFAWSRKDSSVDISPLVAMTLAVWGNAQRQNEPKFEFHSMAEVLARADG